MFGILSTQAQARLKALEALKARVMIADSDLNIVYLNAAVRELLTEAEDDLKAELPRFSVARLVGSNIDVFHKNPTHQRRMLAGLKETHKATIRVGRHVFDLIVTPLVENGRTDGFAVEWANAKERLQNLDFENRMQAVDRVQAVVEFSPEGEILAANANFLKAVGYSMEEIAGRSHTLFLERDYAESPDYAAFWKALQAGGPQIGEFVLVGRNGRTVVLNASYNPIPDETGRIARIVTFATDVTDRVTSVRRLGEGLTRLASGALDFRLDDPFPRDFESLRENFNAALGQLAGALGAVAEATVAIDAGSSEVSKSADHLSRRTEQQAASLEQTAAALDEITVNVQNAARRSEEARKAAELAKASAGHSARVVADAVDAMARIEDSSRRISSIIGVIDEISFQTNLLALNAGVEAARAGEAGKGFAVVAQEVRELAQRAASAAKEIKELIRKSSGEVQGGVRLVSETGEALHAIENNILVVNEQMQAIATAAREQAAGLEEVNTAVNQMDQVTQQNAAMVEESNAASATLAAQAERLRELVGHFRLEQVQQKRVTVLRPQSRENTPGGASAPAVSRPAPAVVPARAAASPRRAAAPARHGNAAPGAESWTEF